MVCVIYLQTEKASPTVEDYQAAESGNKRDSFDSKKELLGVGEKDNKHLETASKGDNTGSGRQHFLREKNTLGAV